MADLGDLLRVRKPASGVYAALTAAYLGAGTAYLALPAETLVHMFSVPACPLVTLSDWVFLWRCAGASLLVLPTWTYSLKAWLLLASAPCVPFNRHACRRCTLSTFALGT